MSNDDVQWTARYFTSEEAANEPPGWSIGWNLIGEVGDDPDPLVRTRYVLSVDTADDGDGGSCDQWLIGQLLTALNDARVGSPEAQA